MIFFILLAISCAIPIGIILAGLEGRVEWFFALSVLMFAYDTCQWLFVWIFARLEARAPHFQPQPATAPSIAVIIPAWNEETALVKTLTTVLSQNSPPDAIIISDDGSTDNTIPLLKAYYDIHFEGNIGRSQTYPHLQVLSKKHTGKGDSINQGVALTDADVVLILDADTRLYPGAMGALRQTFTQYPYLDVVSGTLIPSCPKTLMGGVFEFF